jgi:hypothetical protein
MVIPKSGFLLNSPPLRIIGTTKQIIYLVSQLCSSYFVLNEKNKIQNLYQQI